MVTQCTQRKERLRTGSKEMVNTRFYRKSPADRHSENFDLFQSLKTSNCRRRNFNCSVASGLNKNYFCGLLRLSLRLLAMAHASMLSISDGHDAAFDAGITKYVSSAYFIIAFPGVVVCKSAAVTT